MRPKIDDTWFGSITVEGKRYEYDILIRLSGKVRKREKALSKVITGSAHILSLAEIQDLYRKKAERMLIAAGFQGQVQLSPEATEFLSQRGCAVDLLPTPEAAQRWNELDGRVVGLFHVTC